MDKFARKSSTDPNQEALRQHKADWNQAASHLISKLISAKRGLNGRGDMQEGIPESDIKNPLPNEVSSYLHHLAQEFSALTQGAERIIAEQERYSQTRNQGHQHLSADDGLISEASWWGSRFWAGNFGLKGKNQAEFRIMLKTLVLLKKNLYDVENILTSSHEQAIPKALAEFITSGYSNLFRLAKAFQVVFPEANQSIKQNLMDLPKEDQTVNELIKKLKFLDREYPAIRSVVGMLIAAGSFDRAEAPYYLDRLKLPKFLSLAPIDLQKDRQEALVWVENAEAAYQPLLKICQTLLGVKAGSFEELLPETKAHNDKIKVDNQSPENETPQLHLININDFDEQFAFLRDEYHAMRMVFAFLEKKELVSKFEVDALQNQSNVSKLEHVKDIRSLKQNKQREAIANLEIAWEAHKQLLELAQTKLPSSAGSFNLMIPDLTEGLKTQAHNSVSRYLKRKWLNKPIFRNHPFDDMKGTIVAEIESAVPIINQLLDAVEKQSDKDSFLSLFSQLGIVFNKMLEEFNSLIVVYDIKYPHKISHSNISRLRELQRLIIQAW